jgi:SAM-dependent methyltransferase
MLSDLVSYYNQLCNLTSKEVRQSTARELQAIADLSQDSQLENLKVDILNSFDQFEGEFNIVKNRVYDQIRKEEQIYLQNSYKAYEEYRSHRYEWLKTPHPSDLVEVQEANLRMHVENILNNRLPLADESQELIMNRITRVSSWQNTTMILRPGTEQWINNMVNNDPMYLVDENYDLLTPAMAQFNEIYQNRLRPYVIREDQEQDILWQLPDNQFGLVLAWNYFNHRPFEIVRRYLIELYRKMRPGGMLLMTYNDCDRWQGVKAVEAQVGLYTPGSLIQGFAESLGFEQRFIYHDEGPWTWIEFRKPGEWQSLRGGQTLAKIVPK